MAVLRIELDREDDGRWIAEIPDLPGVMVYGRTRDEALCAIQVLAFNVLADLVEHGDPIPPAVKDLFSITEAR